MKICALTDSHPTDPWDDSDAAMYALLAACADAGHEVVALSENAALVDREIHAGVLYMPSTTASAYPSLAALEPDVIIGHRESGRHGVRYAEYLSVPYVLLTQAKSSAEEREVGNLASLVVFPDHSAQEAFGDLPSPDFCVLSESGEAEVVLEIQTLVGV